MSTPSRPHAAPALGGNGEHFATEDVLGTTSCSEPWPVSLRDSSPRSPPEGTGREPQTAWWAAPGL